MQASQRLVVLSARSRESAWSAGVEQPRGAGFRESEMVT
jgi:hypothetical protein